MSRKESKIIIHLAGCGFLYSDIAFIVALAKQKKQVRVAESKFLGLYK
jgi:hypothetical protein